MSRPCNLSAFVLAGLFCLLAASAPMAAGPSFLETASRAENYGIGAETIGRVASGVEDGRLTDRDGAGLLMPLIEARADQFPLAPFEDKLAEGLAKRVSPARIINVLEARLDAYRFARKLLTSQFDEADPELLAVMGEGVAQGTPRTDLEQYVSEFHGHAPEPFLTGAHMVCLLGQSSFDYGLTRSLLEAAFAADGPSPEWRYFVRLVLVGRQRGLSDADMAGTARRVLGDGGTLNDLSSRLGFTSRNLTGRSDSN